MRILKYTLIAVVVLVIGAAVYFYRLASRQGRDTVDWAAFDGAKVSFDVQGIPTIDAPDWLAVVEAEGFVVASDRLWQMDLMRRSASGRLAEWFGGAANVVAWDEKRKQEDWEGVAAKAVAALPEEERKYCDAYARGVNRFLETAKGRWALEYFLLQEEPEPWKCEDSMLVFLSMIEDLTDCVEEEALLGVWNKSLTKSWAAFLFPQDHPWNIPVFGGATKPIRFPQEKMIASPIASSEAMRPIPTDEFFSGSNAWVYRGAAGTFVANDPHLSYAVPQLWYAIRLKVPGDWVIGTALPGIPGVVLGRNPRVAWGFTNAKEDIDDLLEEEVSPDGKRYVARVGEDGIKQWRNIEERPYSIRVRGGPERKGVARFTHRGPLSQRAYLGKGLYSRQWLAFRPGILRLPTVAVMTASDWTSFNRAIDDFSIPAQSIVFADAKGGIGIRVSGRGVRRRVTGLYPQPALQGEWTGVESAWQRPRKYIPPGKSSAFLSTANQRLWTRGYGEPWSSDLRQERIQEVLGISGALTRADMEQLQLDTHSRFFRQLLVWITERAGATSDKQRQILESWKSWNGDARTDPGVFAQAVYARAMLSALLLGRVRKAFLPQVHGETPYDWRLQSAWEVVLLENDSGWAVFGLDARQVASWLLARMEQEAPAPKGYKRANRWKTQHPFARAAVGVGWLFAVEETDQEGYDGLVRVERPESGATTRLVWDMGSEDRGTWSFPVGESGHPFSPYYTGFRKNWFEGKSVPVLSP